VRPPCCLGRPLHIKLCKCCANHLPEPTHVQALVLCDYLLPGEALGAAAERAAELLAPPCAESLGASGPEGAPAVLVSAGP